MAIGLLWRVLKTTSENASALESKQLTVSIYQSMLRVISLMEQTGYPASPASLLSQDLALVDKLITAMEGKYVIVVEMMRVLERGAESKLILDQVVDACGMLLNIREGILQHRLEFSKVANGEKHLKQGLVLLERYLSLLALASFLMEDGDKKRKVSLFSEWLSERPEIEGIILYVKRKGLSLLLFRPIDSLSSASPSSATLSVFKKKSTDVRRIIDSVTVDFSQFSHAEVERIVGARSGAVLTSGTLLKLDLWKQALLMAGDVEMPNFRGSKRREQEQRGENDGEVEEEKEGRSCFRVYGVGQPTKQGIQHVLHRITASSMCESRDAEDLVRVVWVNLREEPMVYVGNCPFVLRDSHSSLRNIKTYAGISWKRLEAMEQRLKMDVQEEMREKGGKLVVHIEMDDGVQGGVMEREQVCTVREIFDDVPWQIN